MNPIIPLAKAEQANQKADNVQEQLNQAVQDGDQLAETQQARVDEKGNPHATLKARLDAEKQETEQKLNDVTTQLAQTEELVEQLEIINAKSFGVVGDGLTDDTLALQNAFTASAGKRLEIPVTFNCRITNQINIPDEIVINVKGRITCDGDVNYWFHAKDKNRIIFERFDAVITKSFEDRSLLNRCIMVENVGYMGIPYANIEGASTAIHFLHGDELNCGDINLRNVYGTAAQYGYGVNSSAKKTTINRLKIENDNDLHGRHGLYINGSQFEIVNVGSIFTRNWNKNPVNITNTNPLGVANVYINDALFINCNKVPTFNTNGCIHGTSTAGAKVNVHVQTLQVKEVNGPAFSMLEGHDDSYLGSLYAEDLLLPHYPNANLVYFRHGRGKRVGKIHCNSLAENWISCIAFRDSENSSVDDVYVGGSYGDAAVRVQDSSVTVGDIVTDTIPKTASINGVIAYKNTPWVREAVASRPDYLGQFAIVDGDIYVATGVSGVGDWKKISLS